VTVRPSIIQDPVNATVSEGNTAALTCIAAGDPSPMVMLSVCLCVIGRKFSEPYSNERLLHDTL